MTSPRQDKHEIGRSRRLSAPASALDPRPVNYRKKEVTQLSKSGTGLGQWVTTRMAAWRTAPSEMGYRIDMFPIGWHVHEAPWTDDPVEGWLPVVPRGFVKASELAPAPTEDEPTLLTPPPSSSRGSPLSSSNSSSPQADKFDQPSAASARAALLALREEHVRLREANIQLRERELKKRQEIDSLNKARDLTAKELAADQEKISLQKQELEQGDEELRVLLQKLALCREAVVTAVKSIDAVYEDVPDEETQKDANLSSDEAGPMVARARQARSQQAKQKAINAMEADKAICELLAVVGNPLTATDEEAEERFKTSGENAECGSNLEKPLEMKVRSSPTKTCSGDQRAPLRDLNRV
ncbi:unnamed protein product [Symbiodinium pilosum]|uniref:Uncharacterized protein n=1 Tax=Symbiodinium pilosum TaxID=2952 RepID=A0A812U1P9_SYMPI|nr:unnamed protein product [Symbiodinium pilosum]